MTVSPETVAAPSGAANVVLYIDDDPIIARLAERLLGRHGYSVEHAVGREAGLARVERGGVDAIILDHDLGTSSGMEMLAALKERSEAPPVVYVTASSELSVAVEALKAGATDYVQKTVGADFEYLLLAALDQSIHKARFTHEKQRAEREVREARDRAVALLEEVNHRIANSLALVVSLVRMQASALHDPAAKTVLAETQARITAIASLHRSLYTSEDVRNVNLSPYLGSLVDELRQSIASEPRHVTVTFAAPHARIHTDKAISIGMILTELITNAVKYAYPHGVGEVRASLAPHPQGGMTLSVDDDGVGIQHGAAKGAGLGGRIVSAMARTLDSDLVYEADGPGTHARLHLKPELFA
ncbi:MAG TPA: histidine kinase dimerization/phosphoacceptor domain -containing protein [Roseiarcus sp.]